MGIMAKKTDTTNTGLYRVYLQAAEGFKVLGVWGVRGFGFRGSSKNPYRDPFRWPNFCDASGVSSIEARPLDPKAPTPERGQSLKAAHNAQMGFLNRHVGQPSKLQLLFPQIFLEDARLKISSKNCNESAALPSSPPHSGVILSGRGSSFQALGPLAASISCSESGFPQGWLQGEGELCSTPVFLG